MVQQVTRDSVFINLLTKFEAGTPALHGVLGLACAAVSAEACVSLVATRTIITTSVDNGFN